jgi:predicted PurR-regulated permease PerM
MGKKHMTQVTHKIEISIKSIIITLLILLGVWFIAQVKDIILFVFISILIMAALSPIINKLESWKLSRGLSIVLTYLLLLIIIALFIAMIVPPVAYQISNLIAQIPIPPDLAESIKHLNFNVQDFQVIASQLTGVPKILSAIGSAFSGIIVFVSLLVMSFYLLVERVHVTKYLKAFYKDDNKAAKAETFITEVETQIGGWVRAEFTLMFIVGLLTFIGLSLLRVNYALALAVLAGLFEMLPNIGPTISAIPAIAIAYFMVSPGMAVAVAVLYILVQQIENNLIVPLVMRHVVGLSPVITIIILLVGYRLAGVAGAALGIPIFLVGKVVVTELYKLKNQWE